MYGSVDTNQKSLQSAVGFSPNATGSAMFSPPPQKNSSMIEQELKAIEKIKNKQKKEVE